MLRYVFIQSRDITAVNKNETEREEKKKNNKRDMVRHVKNIKGGISMRYW